MNRTIITLSIFVLFGLAGCMSENVKVQPLDLRAEYLESPINIGTLTPRFTWRFEGAKPDFCTSKVEVNIWEKPQREGAKIQVKKEEKKNEKREREMK